MGSWFDFGGLSVDSDFPLESLCSRERPADGACADITVSLSAAAAPAADAVVFEWPGRYRLTLNRAGPDWLMTSDFGAAFRISPDGRRIEAHARRGAADVGFLDVLTRRVLPRVAILHGAVPIHAAAIAGPGGAVLLAGPSGFGKSTFTAMAALLGWNAFGDDVSVLRRAGGRTLMAPTASGICLRPDSRVALGLDDADCRAMPGYDEKVWYQPAAPATCAPLPLRAAVFLSRRQADLDGPVLRPVTAAEGFMVATIQLIHFNPLASAGGEIAAMMDRLAAALEGVPSYVLTCAPGFRSLAAAVDTLAALAS